MIRLTRGELSALSALLCALFGLVADGAAQELVYVRRETREETRRASLEASGTFTLPPAWQLIGPFDNTGLATVYPPEREIDLEARYDGKGEEARWRPFEFPDGQVHSLQQFGQSNQCVCYLYRRIDAERAGRVRASLGSDDGLVVWLNGQELLRSDAARPAAADQEFVNLDLREGRNDLLLKVANQGGDWAFYFKPALPARIEARLERMLDRDFPPAGEAAHWRIETIPLPDGELLEGGGLAFRPDGGMYLATRRGDVWLVRNALSDDIDEIEFVPYARGLHEVLGLTLVPPNDLLLVQRPEVTLLRDTDGDDAADEFITVSDDFGCSGDYHEFLYGPARDAAGNLFITLNVGFGGGHQAKVPYRGCCLKISPDGGVEPWAYGLRSPNGLGMSPAGRLFFTDNQGEWVAACKLHEIRQGEYYGHAASVRWWPGRKDGEQPEMTPPAVWFPYSLSRSASEMVWDTTGGAFGPFAGQCIVGELTNSLLMRVYLEEVQGRQQGACFAMRQDFQSGVNRLCFAPDGSLLVAQTNRGWGSRGGAPHGLQRVIYTGVTPFEIHSMAITADGWELRFTKPVDAVAAGRRETYAIDSYTYHHWATYGSPEIERRDNPVTEAQVSSDGLTVRLAVPDRQPGRVYHMQVRDLKDQAGEPLLHSEAWYTMNAAP
jgi:glucose/arabinose dehydrogenase